MHTALNPTPSIDTLINTMDGALRTLFAAPHASAPCATLPEAPSTLTPPEREQAAGLMRVNHVGEICAQALYTAQALATRNPQLQAHYQAACAEEVDHLAWTAQRLDELGARASLLNPLWYAGAFGLGLLAGRLGEGISLGFVVETETRCPAGRRPRIASHRGTDAERRTRPRPRRRRCGGRDAATRGARTDARCRQGDDDAGAARLTQQAGSAAAPTSAFPRQPYRRP